MKYKTYSLRFVKEIVELGKVEWKLIHLPTEIEKLQEIKPVKRGLEALNSPNEKRQY